MIEHINLWFVDFFNHQVDQTYKKNIHNYLQYSWITSFNLLCSISCTYLLFYLKYWHKHHQLFLGYAKPGKKPKQISFLDLNLARMRQPSVCILCIRSPKFPRKSIWGHKLGQICRALKTERLFILVEDQILLKFIYSEKAHLPLIFWRQ